MPALRDVLKRELVRELHRAGEVNQANRQLIRDLDKIYAVGEAVADAAGQANDLLHSFNTSRKTPGFFDNKAEMEEILKDLLVAGDLLDDAETRLNRAVGNVRKVGPKLR